MIKKELHIKSKIEKINLDSVKNVKSPEYLYVPLVNSKCAKGEVSVNVGDHVSLGQVIGVRHNPLFDQPIHATCSGTFLGLEDHVYKNNKPAKFLKIQNDFKDELFSDIVSRSDEEVEALTKEEILSILKENSTIELDNDNNSTSIKLSTPKPVNTLLISALDDEGYTASESSALKGNLGKVISSIKILKKVLGFEKVKLCVRKSSKTLVSYLITSLKDENIELVQTSDAFLLGYEPYLVKLATNIDVEANKTPLDYGVMTFNVLTLIEIYDAIKNNLPLLAKTITITGDAFGEATLVNVKVGTKLSDVVGSLINELDKVVIINGLIKGDSITSDDLIITEEINSIIINQKIRL